MSTIAEQWAAYEERVVPADASDVQRRVLRLAFYAGAGAFVICMSGGLRGTDEDPNACVSRLVQEVDLHSREVWQGRQ